MTPTMITARDLPDAWFQAIERVLAEGRQWTVERGSYEGQQRWELDYVTIRITHPGARPLVPEMPPGSAIPPPATMEYVEEYLPYLMTTQAPKANEAYTYGERVAPQMEAIIERYRERGFGSNQECISVARPEDIALDDPPCLRSIDCRVMGERIQCPECGGAGTVSLDVAWSPDQVWSVVCPWCGGSGVSEGDPALHFVVYFRSNDLWNGFPVNLAALRLMQEYMAGCLGIQAGEIIYSSKGLHLYDHVWDLAREIVG